MKDIIKTQQQFRQSIRCGTGRAFLLMKKHSEVNFSNEIYKASIKAYAYDTQSEGDRTDYLIQFIKLLPEKQLNSLKQKIIKRLFKENDDTWSLLQLFNLAGYFAIEDTIAKEQIYKRFKQTPIKDSDWLGTDIILKIDGVEGMIKIADHFGKRLSKYENECQDDWLVNNFDRENPKANIKERLRKESKNNPYIAKYLAEIKSTRQKWNKYKSKKKKWSLDTIIEHILNDEKRAPMRSAIAKLKKSELKKIGKMLKSNTNFNQIEKVLYLFSIVKYPFELNDLKKYIKKKYPRSIREYAFKALSFEADAELRNEAISRLPKTRTPYMYLNLLKLNYKEGDSKTITSVINNFVDEHVIETIAISLCEVYKANKTKDCKKPLLALYNKMNCSIHRNSILKILNKNKVLPKKVLNEMRYDCNGDTRNLYWDIKKKCI